MFDAVRNNKRIVQVFLVLIILPFAFWGVDSYFHSGDGGDELASVGGSSISRQEYFQTMRDQQDRLREQLGHEFNPAMLETPEARQAMLDSLVTRRLLLLHAQKYALTAGDAQLIEVIGSIPALQEDGKFSKRRYEQAVRAQGMTLAGFEARLRQDMTLQQLVQAVSDTAVVSHAAAERAIAIQLEERQVSEAAIRPEQYAAQVKLSAEAVREYYEKNRGQFEIPQQIRAEFVVLSREVLAGQITVSAEEIKSAYEKNAANYTTQEERRASHILIQSPADASGAEQARAKIDAILQQVKKNPAEFARLAREHSQDAGSSAQGGDLGFFSRGAMVKPFEDAVFAMQENQVSEVVRSEFGFHIIRLTGIKPGKVRSLEEVRDAIAAELKLEAASKKFAEAAETFSNMVYEQSDSLQPAAEKYRLPLQQTGFFDTVNRAAAGLLASNDKLFTALFSDDALKHKRNTDAIEVAPNTLVAARVLESRPAELRTLESVKAEIEKKLVAEEAARLARKDGEEKLAGLSRGEPIALSWSQPQTVTRQPMRGLEPQAQRAIFKASAEKLPAYAGVALPNGAYVLYRISQVSSAAAKGAEDPRVRAQRAQLLQLSGTEDFNAYLAALRERYGVKINQAALASGDGAGSSVPAPAPTTPTGKL